MKALVFERSLARFAAARVASAVVPGGGARVGPLRLSELDEPTLPGPDWRRVRPRLAGICGSDLATVDGRSSRYFEPIVSFPFVPGHEIVGDVDAARADGGGDGDALTSRVVVEAVLSCATRGIEPMCWPCETGRTGNCERIAFGDLEPGLQTGYCASTGGGWGSSLVAHRSQLHPVPDDLSDEAAVMVEPAACALHAALAHTGPDDHVVVLGSGTLGLCAVAALRRHCRMSSLTATAKHPEQRRLAKDLGADVVVEPGQVQRSVRRSTRSLIAGSQLTGGAQVVIDCVGSADSLADALAVVAPRGTVVLVGMPGAVNIDLTSLWHREVNLVGAYAYGREHSGARTFDLAFDLVREAGLERLVSVLYPLERWQEAVGHAAEAGRRGAVKVAFDLRPRPGTAPGGAGRPEVGAAELRASARRRGRGPAGETGTAPGGAGDPTSARRRSRGPAGETA